MWSPANHVPVETLIAQVTDQHRKIAASHDDPRLTIHVDAGPNLNGGIAIRSVPVSYLQNPLFYLDDAGYLNFIATNQAGVLTRRRIATEPSP